MKLEQFIAKRYFISKHKLNFITVITLISTAGITIGVASLIVVLSVFNGFGSLVENLLTSLDPDLKIESVSKWDANFDKSNQLELIREKIKAISPYTIKRSLLESKYSQSVADLKGIEKSQFYNLYDSNKINLYKSSSRDSSTPGIFLGVILANELQVQLDDTITVYVPSSINSFLSGFAPISKNRFVVEGIFYSQNNQYDRSLAIIDLKDSFALIGGNDNLINGYEISLKNIDELDEVKKFIKETLSDVIILEKYEIHKELFSVMKIERWVAYLLLSLIIAVATFNILSSLTMTVLEKKRDISIMKSLGISEKSILKIFLNEGAIIGAMGTILGLILGLLVCWLQLEFKIYPLDPTQYKIDSLPLEIQITDFFTVAFVSMSLSLLAAAFPSVRASKTNIIDGIKWE
jgi:lipoprotein-releasing system permease protein